MIELLQTVYSSKDAQAKNRVIAILANVLDSKMSKKEEMTLASIIREALLGKHFDHASAKERISRIYYVSEDGTTNYAPFISETKCRELYEDYQEHLAGYNEHDFAVVLNDTIANFHNLLHAWWYNEEDEFLLIKYCELAVNWLNDDDSQFHGEKAWRLLSEKE